MTIRINRLPKRYSATGDKYIRCHGTAELESRSGVIGKALCLFPIAISDGTEFLITSTGRTCRRAKVSCPECGYVMTLSPKML